MKKLDDKILNEARAGHEEIKNQDGADAATCDCCNLSSSPLSVTESEDHAQDGFEQIHDDNDHHDEDNKYKRNFLIILNYLLLLDLL
jgi:hypothetical protein